MDAQLEMRSRIGRLSPSMEEMSPARAMSVTPQRGKEAEVSVTDGFAANKLNLAFS